MDYGIRFFFFIFSQIFAIFDEFSGKKSSNMWVLLNLKQKRLASSSSQSYVAFRIIPKWNRYRLCSLTKKRAEWIAKSNKQYMWKRYSNDTIRIYITHQQTIGWSFQKTWKPEFRVPDLSLISRVNANRASRCFRCDDKYVSSRMSKLKVSSV